MRVGATIALTLLLVAPALSLGAPTPTDHFAPVVRMLNPARLSPARFAVLRVTDAGSGLRAATLTVNGRRIAVGDLAATGRLAFRERAGWEPRRLYRIQMRATDHAGNVRRFRRAIRARRFGIVALAVRNLTRARTRDAHAARGCGYVHLRPRGFRLGSAPLAIGDSVMLGAAWRLTRAGFEADTFCGRSPHAGLEVLQRRRQRGTLPSMVVMALGTNSPMSSRDIAAMLRVLGPRRKLMLVTPLRSGREVNSGSLRRAARRHPRRVSLIDWSTLARRHPSWLWGDGTHLQPRGLPGYTRLIHRAAWRKLRGRYVVR
jgi:hypothetical protein